MNHQVAEISSVFVDSPDVVLVIRCTCGETYGFTKEFHPEWNMWSKSYYTDAVMEAYLEQCPTERPMEKRAVVLTEKEKEAHSKAASKAQQRRIEHAAQKRADRKEERENAEKEKE